MAKRQKIPASKKRKAVTRRQFIVRAGAAILSFVIVKPKLVRGTEANSKIALGMIGCGSRGTWIAELFHKHGRFNIVAAADYFQDRVDAFGEKYGVKQNRRYTGLSCYQKLLEAKVDAVAIESPPYFHPEQAALAIDAGCHVFLAKPVAVDVPGCRLIAESSKKAAGRLCFLVDFQTRANATYREAVKRAQYGDIGQIICGESAYHCGATWSHMEQLLQADPANPEVRLRCWGRDRALSGDIITEQNIHALDVVTWILDQHPVRAYGTGGQKVRTVGDCWDHFSVIYTFPGDVVVTFNSRQFGQGYDDILCRMYGTNGTIDTHYFGKVHIRGNRPYKGADMVNLYTEGAVNNIAEFYDNITKRRFSNPTVAASVRSNLTTILGRTAAYKRREVSWDEMMNANEKIEARLEGLKV